MSRALLLAACLALLAAPATGWSADLYRPGAWSALASDRQAGRIGDSLTVVIYESSVASNQTLNGSRKTNHLGGGITSGASFNKSGDLDLRSNFDGAGQTSRSDKMVGQISVVVDEVLPNGDLHVSGAQSLKVNGERTSIRLKGRVRMADISSDNVVLSTRLADAVIDYDGSGFATAGARAGVVAKLFNWLRLP